MAWSSARDSLEADGIERLVVVANVGLKWRRSLLNGTESLRFRRHPVVGDTCLISEKALQMDYRCFPIPNVSLHVQKIFIL